MANISQSELRVVDLLVEAWVTGYLSATLSAELAALHQRDNWPSVSALFNKMVNIIRERPQGRGPESAEDVRRYLIDNLAAMGLGEQPPQVDLNYPPPGLRKPAPAPAPAPVPEPAPPRVVPRRDVVDRQAMLRNLIQLWRTGQLSPELKQQLKRFGPLADRSEFLGKFVRSACEQPRTYPYDTEASVRVYLDEHLRRLLPDPPPKPSPSPSPPPSRPPHSHGEQWIYGNELWQALADAQTRAAAEAQAQAEAIARARAKARAEFATITRQMAQAKSRDELVELTRRRAELAPRTGMDYTYENHCWACGGRISSSIHAQCPTCGWYICSCGACSRGNFGH